MRPSPGSLALSVTVIACLILIPAQACMTFVVTPGASADGSMYLGHIEDGFGESLIGTNISQDNIYLLYIPAADHAPGEKRLIRYDPYAEWTATDPPQVHEPVTIDQVSHTFGYFTTNNGAMNEHQLMSGEAGRASKVMPSWDPEKRVMYTSELTNIIMERCTNAREAVELAGALVNRYGFYSSGEILTFADPEEAWVMEFAGGTSDGTGGLWVAQKIPDREVFVSANAYRIREVRPNSSDMLYSPQLFASAEKNGWWKPEDGPLDWAAVVADGEYCHPYYSDARVWSMYNRMAPSLNLSPYVSGGFPDPYPFTIRPDNLLNTSSVFGLVRDHYEGTPFDLTQGIAAGPFGNPYRITGPYEYGEVVEPGVISGGAWQRPVSTLYSPYTYIGQARSDLPDPVGGVLWFGFGPSYETSFIPIYAGVTRLPASFSKGSRKELSQDSAWWPFNLAANLATIRYDRMSQDIRKEQERIEGQELGRQTEMEKNAVGIFMSRGDDAVRQYLTDYTNNNAQNVIADRWNLSWRLMETYLNGDMYEDGLPDEAGYPAWWLDTAGYQYGPRVYQIQDLWKIRDLHYENGKTVVIPGDEIAALTAHAAQQPPQPAAVPGLLSTVPDVRQSQSFSCGAASLQAVFNYWGIDMREGVLIGELGTSEAAGTPPDSIVRVAQAHGLTAEFRTNLTLADLERANADKVPVIISCQAWSETSPASLPWDTTWEDGHYMVVIGLDNDNIYFEDPAISGTRGVIPRQEFLSRWHDYSGETPFSINSTVLYHPGISIRGNQSATYPAFTHVD